MRSILYLVATSFVLLGEPALAVDKRLAARWNDSISNTSTLLKQQKYAEALPILKRVATEMVSTLGKGPEAANILGLVAVQRAIAEAGLGNSRDAVWYWHVALSLNPKFAESDLSAFGDPGVRVKHIRLRDVSVDEGVEGCVDCEPPRVKHRVEPRYPRGANFYAVRGELVVDVVITREGKTSEPRVIKPLPAPSLSYSALEALKQWEFEPAIKNSERLEVQFRLTINYKR